MWRGIRASQSACGIGEGMLLLFISVSFSFYCFIVSSRDMNEWMVGMMDLRDMRFVSGRSAWWVVPGGGPLRSGWLRQHGQRL